MTTTPTKSHVTIDFPTTMAVKLRDLVQTHMGTLANWIESDLVNGNHERARELALERVRFREEAFRAFNHALREAGSDDA